MWSRISAGAFSYSVCGLILLAICQAQTFEVATVKLSSPGARINSAGGPGTSDPARYTCTSCPLLFLVRTAYNLPPEQIKYPSWFETETYDVAARIPARTTKEQFDRMLAGLLAERLKMVVHRQSKEVRGYNLVVGKGGVRMKPNSDSLRPVAGALPKGSLSRDAEGFPVLPAGIEGPLIAPRVEGSNTVAYYRANQSMDKLAQFLTKALKKPVSDATGLSGRYEVFLTVEVGAGDATLNGVPIAGQTPQSPDRGIEASLARLGLGIVAARTTLQTLVVDRAERRPAAN